MKVQELIFTESHYKLAEELRQRNGQYPEEEKGLVSQIQHILSVLGYDIGPTGVDGKYGPNTAKAIGNFKKDYKLPGDGSVFGERSLQTIEKIASGQLAPVKPFKGQQQQTSPQTAPDSSVRPPTRPGRQDSPSPEFTRPPSGSNALFSMDGASRMTKPDAAENIAKVLQGPYKRMVSLFGSEVRINDAIAKAGTSREGKTPGSQHFHGKALDLDVSGFGDRDRLRLVAAAKKAGFSGFGFGRNILHVDIGPARYWDYGNSSYGGMQVAQLGNAVMDMGNIT